MPLFAGNSLPSCTYDLVLINCNWGGGPFELPECEGVLEPGGKKGQKGQKRAKK